MEGLAERLKWLREENRLAQKEVAANIGVTLSGYQKIEYDQANPKIDTLVRMAKYFNVTTDFLLGLSDNINDLSTLREEIMSFREELEILNHEKDHANAKRFELERSIYEEQLDKDKVESLRRRLTDIQQEIDYYQHKFYQLHIAYEKALFDYICKIYKIPNTKPENDTLLKDFYPLVLALEEKEGEYKIRLKSLRGTNLGLLYNSNDKIETLDKLKEYGEFFRLSN